MFVSEALSQTRAKSRYHDRPPGREILGRGLRRGVPGVQMFSAGILSKEYGAACPLLKLPDDSQGRQSCPLHQEEARVKAQ